MLLSYTKNDGLYRIIEASVRDMLTTQEENGRFSTYTLDTEFTAWDIWGRKYVMLGMTYFFDICKSKELKRRIITALRRHADYIVDHVGDGEGKIDILDTAENIGAMNACSILEPFVKLYELTSDKKYLDFATYLIGKGLCKDTDLVALALGGELYPYQYPVTKAYEMMSCFEGVLEYYKHVGDPNHLLAVERFVDALIKTDYTVVGGSGCEHEFLDNSTRTQTEPATKEVMQETCVTVTLMKLCAKLLLLTGNAKYAEYIERSGFNAMYGSVNNEKQGMKRALVRTWRAGGEVVYIKEHEGFPFDSYSPLYLDSRGTRCGGVQLIGEGRCYGCCVCIGSAGTAIMGLVAVMKGDKGLFVNLYNDCKFKTDAFGERVMLDVRANPYNADKAKIRINGNAQAFSISLRVPSWAESFSVRVNGQNADGTLKDGYFVIDRVWNCDVVEVDLKTKVRMRVINGKIAFTRGPIVLARDSRLGNIEAPLTMSAKDGKSVRAKRVKNSVFDSNVAYEIKTKNGTLMLCDYAQAGKNYDEDSSKITVWHDRAEK